MLVADLVKFMMMLCLFGVRWWIPWVAFPTIARLMSIRLLFVMIMCLLWCIVRTAALR